MKHKNVTLYGIVDEQKTHKNLHITELINNFEHLKSHNMKHILTIIFLIVTITACQRHSNVYMALVQADTLLAKEENDSALRQLLKIDTAMITSESDRAYYNLLYTNTLFRLQLPVNSDSAIDISIKYYEKSQDKSKLARSLYYKGMTIYERNGDIKKVIECVKKAEYIAENAGEEALLNSIYANLSTINYHTRNFNTALDYAKKSLDLSKKLGNKKMIGLSLNKISNAFTNLMQFDSSMYYSNKIIPYIKYIKSKEYVGVITNISADFYNQKKFDEAEKYAKMSLSIKPTSYAYFILGNIYIEQGKESEAFELWNRAMSKGSPIVRAEVMSWMADIKKEQGEYREAAELMTKSKAMKDSIEQSKNTEKMLSLQNEIDKAEAARQADMKLKTAAVAATVAVAALALLLVIHRRKINRSKKRLGEIERLTDRYRKEIDELSLSKDENERKISSLSRKLDTLREQRAAIIGLGQRRYEEIIGGGNTAEWKKTDFEAAVEYGRTLMPDDIAAIEKSHRRLTPYNTFFLMLPLAGLSDSDIQRAMNMTAGAVRTMRYRLRRSPLNSPRGGA